MGLENASTAAARKKKREKKRLFFSFCQKTTLRKHSIPESFVYNYHCTYLRYVSNVAVASTRCPSVLWQKRCDRIRGKGVV